jgi:hypothetical protein
MPSGTVVLVAFRSIRASPSPLTPNAPPPMSWRHGEDGACGNRNYLKLQWRRRESNRSLAISGTS